MKYILKSIVITVVILAVSLVAAPFFVRQEQIKSFIESKVKLSDGKKLKLDGKIKFGVFPTMYAKIPTVSIIDKDGKVQKFEKFRFGFTTSDLLGDSIKFDSTFENDGTEYEGNLHIKDYQKFLDNGQSEMTLKLEEPMRIRLKGDFIHQDNIYSLKDFTFKYKQTDATGNIKVTTEDKNNLQVDLNTEIKSDNIENIRRLIQFGKNNDEFNLLSGSGKVKLNITTKGSSEGEMKQNLNGEGYVTITDGAIYGVDLNELIGAPQTTELSENSDRKIDIKEADTIFKITNGLVKVEELNANNQFANITGSGVINVPTNEIKMGIDINADIASAKVNIPLLVFGNFNKIKFAPRVGDALISNIDTIQNLSKIKLKDVKIDFKNGGVDGAVNQLRTLGKGFGFDLDKATGGATKDIGIQPTTPAIQAPAEPQTPAEPAVAPTSN